MEKTMKRNLMMAGVLMASAFATSAAMADPGMDLAKAKNCLACHAVSTKLVGPAYKDVAAKYAGQKDAEAKLATKVIKGGSGTWGAIPMPANPQVTEAEAKTLVKWVLAQK
jgi:cytochrome c